MTSSYTDCKQYSVGFQPSRVGFPGYFHFWSFAHYLDMQLPTHPRRSDCPGRFLSAEPLRTSRTSSKAMYNRPNSFYLPKAKPPQLPEAPSGRMAVSDDTPSFWIEPPTNCHGSAEPEPLRLRTVSTVWRSQLVFDLHSQGIRRLCGMYIIANPSLSSNTEKISMCNNLGRQFMSQLHEAGFPGVANWRPRR